MNPETQYIGKTCKRGHSGLRWRANRICVECHRERKREYDRRYRVRNLEKCRESNRKYRLEHLDRERDREHKRAWRARNPDSDREYYKNNRERIRLKQNEYRSVNRERLNEARRERYKKERARILEANRNWRVRISSEGVPSSTLRNRRKANERDQQKLDLLLAENPWLKEALNV